MRRNVLGAVLLVSTLVWMTMPGIAAAGSSAVGVRYGWMNATGELFKGSGDLGSGDMVGIQLELGLLPTLSVEAAGEYVNQKLAFNHALFDDIAAQGDVDYEDVTLYLTGRWYAISLMALPLKIYGGGGLHVHYADVTVENATEAVVPKADPEAMMAARHATGDTAGDLERAIEDATGARTRVAWHAVAGVRLDPPGSPILIFVEGRYAEPFEDGLPKVKSVYAGLSIRL
jgi:hypothetical protein